MAMVASRLSAMLMGVALNFNVELQSCSRYAYGY